MLIVQPTSGTIGPGHYNCDKPSISIRERDRPSPPFLKSPAFDIELMSEKFETVKPRFGPRYESVRRDHTQSLNARGVWNNDYWEVQNITPSYSIQKQVDENKLSHIANNSLQKISKVYPRLAKKVYGKKAIVQETH